jgi:hypothetical protein
VLGIDHHNVATAAAQHFVDAKVLEVAAIGEIEEGAILIGQSQSLDE